MGNTETVKLTVTAQVTTVVGAAAPASSTVFDWKMLNAVLLDPRVVRSERSSQYRQCFPGFEATHLLTVELERWLPFEEAAALIALIVYFVKPSDHGYHGDDDWRDVQAKCEIVFEDGNDARKLIEKLGRKPEHHEDFDERYWHRIGTAGVTLAPEGYYFTVSQLGDDLLQAAK